MSAKLYNPKIHAPAVYIPNWLAQVPANLISLQEKFLYGRIAHWSNDKGQVFRSAYQLSEETGVPPRTIEFYLKKLRDCKLIRTFRVRDGGVNHFEFLYHHWMDVPINKHLVYAISPTARIVGGCTNFDYPPQPIAVPPATHCGTPPQPIAVHINKKESKKNKNVCVEDLPLIPTTHTHNFSEFFSNSALRKLFDDKFSEYDVNYEQIIENCANYYKNNINNHKVMSWINSERVNNYAKRSAIVQSEPGQVQKLTQQQKDEIKEKEYTREQLSKRKGDEMIKRLTAKMKL